MKVYIAGPMSGLPEKNYQAFNDAEKQLRELGHEPLNPVWIDDLIPDGVVPEYDWFLRQTMTLLVKAEGVALLPDWDQSVGATVEVAFARACKMEIHALDIWMTPNEVV